jgi:hypothetical protein
VPKHTRLDVPFALAYADQWDVDVAREIGATASPTAASPIFTRSLLDRLMTEPAAWFDSREWGDIATSLCDHYWRGKRWMTPAEWMHQAIAIVPEYNDFNAKEVGAWLAEWTGAARLGTIMVRPAREGSVALYIKAPAAAVRELAEEARRMVQPDEVDIRRGILRLWWD